MAAERHTFKRRRLVCATCDARSQPLLWDYDPAPLCPADPTHGPLQPEWDGRVGASASVIGDECDVTIRHGICHEDGEPRRFRSKSEFRAACKATGWTPMSELGHKTGEVARWNER